MSFQSYAILVILGSGNLIALLVIIDHFILRRPKPPEPKPRNVRKKGLDQRYIR